VIVGGDAIITLGQNSRNSTLRSKTHLNPLGSGFELREKIAEVCNNDGCKGGKEAWMRSVSNDDKKSQNADSKSSV
jgi:hypothetical protein